MVLQIVIGGLAVEELPKGVAIRPGEKPLIYLADPLESCHEVILRG